MGRRPGWQCRWLQHQDIGRALAGDELAGRINALTADILNPGATKLHGCCEHTLCIDRQGGIQDATDNHLHTGIRRTTPCDSYCLPDDQCSG